MKTHFVMFVVQKWSEKTYIIWKQEYDQDHAFTSKQELIIRCNIDQIKNLYKITKTILNNFNAERNAQTQWRHRMP